MSRQTEKYTINDLAENESSLWFVLVQFIHIGRNLHLYQDTWCNVYFGENP